MIEYAELKEHVGHSATVDSAEDGVIVIHCNCGDDLVAAERPKVVLRPVGFEWTCPSCSREFELQDEVDEVTCECGAVFGTVPPPSVA